MVADPGRIVYGDSLSYLQKDRGCSLPRWVFLNELVSGRWVFSWADHRGRGSVIRCISCCANALKDRPPRRIVGRPMTLMLPVGVLVLCRVAKQGFGRI